MRWVISGTVFGALLALLVFAPASWLASALAAQTGQRLLLADARGTVWRGSAVPVLTGGADSRDASALPGRLSWAVGLDGAALSLQATHACCINGALRLRIEPGWNRVKLVLPPSQGAIGQWPAAWLAGLGTPWNTLQPSGSLHLSSPGLSLEAVQGRWLFNGRADIELNGFASRVSTLDVLGSYRFSIVGDATSGDAAVMTLSTTSGALLLTGRGQWAAAKFRFQGEARAAAGSEAVLNNLLNIIGRRQGAVAVISIG
jgi:general secretion pathway protein N